MKDAIIVAFVAGAVVAVAWLSGPITVHVQHNISITVPLVMTPPSGVVMQADRDPLQGGI
jgi:hypothetical protein